MLMLLSGSGLAPGAGSGCGLGLAPGGSPGAPGALQKVQISRAGSGSRAGSRGLCKKCNSRRSHVGATSEPPAKALGGNA